MKPPSKPTQEKPHVLSARARRITKWGDYVPRVRHPHEALPPENNLWTRPVYNPARDNK